MFVYVMAQLTEPATPSRSVARPTAAAWSREGLKFSGRHDLKPSLASVPRSRGVSFSPSKRVVSYDSGHPTSAKKPFREESLVLHREPETPTRVNRDVEADGEWQDLSDDQHGYSEADTTDFTEGSSLFQGFSPNSSNQSTIFRRLRRGTLSPRVRLQPRSPHTPRATPVAATPSRSASRSRMATPSFDSYIDSPLTSREPHGSGKWRLDPSLPFILASYAQLGFNLIMMGLVVYAVWIFLSTIRNDVDLKVEEYSADILNEIYRCSQEYSRNNCQPGKRVPALETICNVWEDCMNRDHKMVGRARVSAETFGEIVNSFLAPIGIKSMVFIVCAFAGSFVLINLMFASKYGPTHVHAAPPPPPPIHLAHEYSNSMPATPTSSTHPYMLNYRYSARRSRY